MIAIAFIVEGVGYAECSSSLPSCRVDASYSPMISTHLQNDTGQHFERLIQLTSAALIKTLSLLTLIHD